MIKRERLISFSLLFYIINNYYTYFYFINYNIMQSNILNIENWSSYKDEVGTHYTYKRGKNLNKS